MTDTENTVPVDPHDHVRDAFTRALAAARCSAPASVIEKVTAAVLTAMPLWRSVPQGRDRAERTAPTNGIELADVLAEFADTLARYAETSRWSQRQTATDRYGADRYWKGMADAQEHVVRELRSLLAGYRDSPHSTVFTAGWRAGFRAARQRIADRLDRDARALDKLAQHPANAGTVWGERYRERAAGTRNAAVTARFGKLDDQPTSIIPGKEDPSGQ
ncbi:hypothetical protein LI90_4348 (plasmid) [Carbonactinospora thermoautotrophica]|uniref:Uncharacterized protein n=1 Tax=Carbonactinospora thermoautotrophica TaxID=1469144 RepID=A0A132MHQ6_9ACTN|nr:hypothetical protein [Carbonactinospora thermoautotrophica]KWW97376.1 hypothetical protein LI90_4348 [Carbonactinospora thermoautotrophica]